MPDFPFDADSLASITRLGFRAGLPSVAAAVGHRRARRSGEGIDFLDYRRYEPGDDVRRIDWGVFARLRQPFIRIQHSEEVVHVTLVVDLSRSMAFGSPVTKASLACQLASSLSFVALRTGDHVSLAVFTNALHYLAQNLHATLSLQSIVHQLKEQPVGGVANMAEVARMIVQMARHRGLVIILSDFLGTGNVESAVQTLLARRFRVLLIQILDGLDWAVGFSGLIRVTDSETREQIDIQATEAILSKYREGVEQHVKGLESFCLHHGQMFARASTSESFLEILTRTIRQQGLFQ